MIPYGMCVPVAVWQLCELLYTCYLLTYLLTPPLNLGQAPKFSRALGTPWSIDSNKKVVNLMPPDVSF